MAFADPEQLEAILASIEAANAPFRDEDSVRGSLCRTSGLMRAFYRWQTEEIARGSSNEIICTAGSLVAGTLVGTLAAWGSLPGDEHAIVVRLLNETIQRAVFEASAAKRIPILFHEGRVS